VGGRCLCIKIVLPGKKVHQIAATIEVVPVPRNTLQRWCLSLKMSQASIGPPGQEGGSSDFKRYCEASS
jgi:hypothetical protein